MCVDFLNTFHFQKILSEINAELWSALLNAIVAPNIEKCQEKAAGKCFTNLFNEKFAEV